MFDQKTTVETECEAAEHETPMAGPGYCIRCQSEGSPHPCGAFVGTGTICQRNWCAHNWADHA
ncbi:MAG: hypothetical protein LKG22_13250 [Sphingobium sp.]|jgi:hypothetical protein|nr:hypothetical protein [Sphingomonadaceae bacterium]MCI1272585.1 hypothetical protein [Sphingobium sp.]